ncbi:MAG TPA: LacI family DNA-binding transcriptional regulator [Tepidisphaeraceae bacterium]|nr:LacI family DNA-binding transcriptional regulator [Tepidisphaeraceae bacterium]
MHDILQDTITLANLNPAAAALAPQKKRPRAPRRTKAVRLVDVARLAGVSTATVSMVVNNHPRISPTTQRRVRRAVEKLGYRPNFSNQALGARRSSVLSILLPAQRHTFADGYFGELLSGVCDQANVMGYTVMFERVSGDFTRARQHLALLEQRVAQGALLLGFSDYNKFVADFDPQQHAVVVVDNAVDRADLDFVGCDYRSGAEQAMTYLLQLGHRKIGLITSAAGGRSTQEIVDVYRSAMAQQGVRPGEGYVADGKFTEAGGTEAADEILRRHPEVTAILAASDTMAIGAIHGASKRGMSVPKDLSVVGIDDLRHAAFISPALTTVRLPLHAVGARACERLVERINGRTAPTSDRLPAHLVLRDSVAMARDLSAQSAA